MQAGSVNRAPPLPPRGLLTPNDPVEELRTSLPEFPPGAYDSGYIQNPRGELDPLDTNDPLFPILPRTESEVSRQNSIAMDIAGSSGGITGLMRRISNPMRAYHGSPHTFDRFDIARIGSGEGNQTYGHGLYFAQSEPVAVGYRNRLGYTNNWQFNEPEAQQIWRRITPYLVNKGYEIPARITALPNFLYGVEKRIEQQLRRGSFSGTEAQANELLNNLSVLRRGIDRVEFDGSPIYSGNVYEVNLHTSPDRLLDLNSGLGGQSEYVQRALQDNFGITPSNLSATRPTWVEAGNNTFALSRADSTNDVFGWVSREGQQWYADLPGQNYLGPFQTAEQARNLVDAAALGREGQSFFGPRADQRTMQDIVAELGTPAEQARNLYEVGIDGNRYLDGFSRIAPDDASGTRNIVMFGDEPVEIVRRYYKGGTPGFADGGIMSPDEQYFAEQADGEMVELPLGATPKGVKDDIDIKISEGELVIPEDVARWHGLKWFMEARHEAKEGLALMASEGLIKRPEGSISSSEMAGNGLMSAPDYEDDDEYEFFDGGIAEADNAPGEGGASDGGGQAAAADAAEAAASNPTFEEAQAYGPSPDTAPAAVAGFDPSINPEIGGSRNAATQDAAIANAAAMNSGMAGYLGGLAGGRAEVAIDPQTGLFGTAYSAQPAQAVANIAGTALGFGLGVPSLGRAAGKAVGRGLDALGVEPTPLGFDPTNNGFMGAVNSGVQGFGFAGTDVNNDNTGEETAYESLMRNPYV